MSNKRGNPKRSGATINFRGKEIERPLIGKFLVELRNKHNMTGEQASEFTGVPQCYIAQIEAGYYHPSRRRCDMIAQSFRIDADELWELRQKSFAEFGRSRPSSTNRRNRLVHISAWVDREQYDYVEANRGDRSRSFFVDLKLKQCREADAAPKVTKVPKTASNRAGGAL